MVPLVSLIPPHRQRGIPTSVSLGDSASQANFPRESEKTLHPFPTDTYKEIEAQRGADRPEVPAGLTTGLTHTTGSAHTHLRAPPSLETLTMSRRCHVPGSRKPHSLGHLKGKGESEWYLVFSRIKNSRCFPSSCPSLLPSPRFFSAQLTSGGEGVAPMGVVECLADEGPGGGGRRIPGNLEGTSRPKTT